MIGKQEATARECLNGVLAKNKQHSVTVIRRNRFLDIRDSGIYSRMQESVMLFQREKENIYEVFSI